ncbi:MAG TPA: wax ester/triacylglycerol synthase family O-acyltransferase [Acidimicrobiales bacterium]|nr:wax ester/triacylglycerol synthase family O-acyltransferase [Acidimicrobiales bacterium]
MVERLSGLDASFLAMETPTMKLHLSAVMVFAPPVPTHDETQLPVERVRRLVGERLHLVPPLRRRAVRVPFGLHHPVWVEDPAFDLDFHVRRASIPAPGGPNELSAFVGELAGRPLDLDRPLWEMHVVEGLESGHFAIVTKLHHATIDGASGADLLAVFFDLGPEQQPVPPPDRPWQPDDLPTERELVAGALSSLTRQPERAASAVRRTVGAVRSLAERNRRLREEDGVDPPPAPFSAPRTSLNGAISAHRRFAFLHVPLDDVQTIRGAFGGTVNDVVLACVGGALRRLLAERGEVLDDPLVAMVPMSTRSPADAGVLGNKVHAMLVSLATTVADPVERLRVISSGTRLAKEQAQVLSEDLLREWAQLAVPALSSRLARLAGNLRLFDHVPALFNVLVSNIPGPDVPLWCAGARLVALYPVGPLADGAGLNVTVISYTGTLYVGILGCRGLVPEVDHVAHHLSDSLGELLKVAMRTGGHWA